MLAVNARISRGLMEQLVAIVAVCRLIVLKRMPGTPLTLFMAHRLREQVKEQVQKSGKIKSYGAPRTHRRSKLSVSMAGIRPHENLRSKCFGEQSVIFLDGKRMSERRSRERSTCLACKIFICITHQKGDDVISKAQSDENNRTCLLIRNQKRKFDDFVLKVSETKTK